MTRTPERAERMLAFEAQAREALTRVANQAATLAAANAGMLRAIADYARLHPPPDLDPTGSHALSAPDELALTLAISTGAATTQMTFAETVVRRLPQAVQALEDGVLDLQRLHSLENATRPLSDTLATDVETQMLAHGPRRHRRAFTKACRRAVINLDPHGAAQRAAHRRGDRAVRLHPGDDATSTLTALLPAEDAAACYQHLDHLATRTARSRASDDLRTRDQIRADILVDLLTGRTPLSPIPCETQVVVPVTTLLGLTTEPGEIPGYGPVPAEIARDIANRPGSTWRRILTDPAGALLEVADRRFPSPAQVRHIRARNRHCTQPTCTRPATHTETDHTIPHAAGGPTHTHNLGPACLKHHKARHDPERPWTVTQPHPGTFTWTSPLGTTTTTHPHNYLTGEEDSGPEGGVGPVRRSSGEGEPSTPVEANASTIPNPRSPRSMD